MLKRCSVLAVSLAATMVVSGFSPPFQAGGTAGGLPQWIWVLIILVIAVVLAAAISWWLAGAEEESETPLEEATRMVADDLTRIEGIGPKISALLQGAGISSFELLADTGADRLAQILADADLKGIANPSTWPEQARLAAQGDWARLETLQDELKGGRRA